MQISVVILNWNNKDVIINCLEAVQSELAAIDSETTVVDNGSIDGSLELIKQKFSNVNLIENKENLGFAKGVNQGVQKSRGKYVLLLGSDTEVQKGSVQALLNRLESLGDEYAAVAPQLLNSDGSIQPSCRNFPTPLNLFADMTFLWKLFPKSKIFGNYRLTYWDHHNERDVVQPQMTCMLVRREVFEKIGLLDEDFSIYFNDVDWCYRVNKADFKIRFVPDAKVKHIYGHSTKKWRGKRVKLWREGLLKFYKKWYGGVQYLPLRLLLKYISIIWLIVK